MFTSLAEKGIVKVKKKIAIIILGLTVALSVGACGKEDNSIKETETSCIDTIENSEVVATEYIEQSETEEPTFWGEVGIKDGIGTVYNGDTIELIKKDEGYNGIVGTYEFEKTEGFLQFAEINHNYKGVDVRLWVKEKGKARIELSGEYELEELYQFNDYGKGYNLIVDGKCILWFETDCDNASTLMEDCDIYAFQVYPTEGLVLNGYEFKDLQMCNVINNFGNPNVVNYMLYDDGSEEIIYSYKKTDTDLYFLRETDGSYKVGSTDKSSEVSFMTSDGKSIESIDISLVLPEKDIRADEEKIIYQLGDNIEMEDVQMSTHPDMKDVIGTISLTIFGINNDAVEGHVIISNPKSQDSEWIFLYEVECSFLDENLNFVETTMGYNVALSDDGFDNGDFKDGDDCDIAFRTENPDKIMYLKLGYNTSDGFNNIYVKLR